MRVLYRLSIRYPRFAVLIGLLTVFATAPGVVRLQIRTDGHALIPHDAPWIKNDREVRRLFGVEDPIAVLIRANHPRGVFNPETLEHVQRLTERFQRLPNIHPWNVISLATEKSDRVRPGTLIFRRFLEPFPCSERQLEQLRDDLRAIALYDGTLVSHDELTTAILVGTPTGIDRTDLYRSIVEAVEQDDHYADTVDVVGAPVAEALLGTHILQDLGVPRWILGHSLVEGNETVVPSRRFSLRGACRWIDRTLGLVPVAILLMGVVFLVSFRSVTATALPLIEVGACLAFVFGLMGYLNVPVYLTVAVLPVILTAVGIADEIHIFARYRDLLRAAPDATGPETVTQVMDEMFTPVTRTSLTTAVGFLSFALSPIRPVQVFGLFTAVGILFCLFWSLTVIPASLVLAGPDRLRPAKTRTARHRSQHGELMDRFASGVIRYRYLTLLLGVAVVAIAPMGLSRLFIQDSWIDGFSPDSRFYRATTRCNRQFLGTHTLLVRIDADAVKPITGKLSESSLNHKGIYLPNGLVDNPTALIGCRLYLHREMDDSDAQDRKTTRRPYPPWDAMITDVQPGKDRFLAVTTRKSGSPLIAMRHRKGKAVRFDIRPEPLTRPELLRRIESLELFLDTHREEAVGGVLGPAGYLKTTSFMAQGRRAGSRAIPDNRDRIRWLWRQYGVVRSPERLAQAVTPDFSSALIHVFMKNANFVDTARLIKDIHAYERRYLKPAGLSLTLAGDVAVSQTLIEAIVTTQVRSLIGSLLGILLITAWMGHSLWRGLLCVLPCLMAVLVNFAVMGWIAMPLGVATSMFSGMTLGIGVDYAIHLLERFRFASVQDTDARRALVDAVQTTGPAILIDAFAVALGFGVLMMSQVPANARLGGLLVLSIAVCLATTLLLLPAILAIAHRIGRRSTIAGRG